jgi:hypothetical protein
MNKKFLLIRMKEVPFVQEKGMDVGIRITCYRIAFKLLPTSIPLFEEAYFLHA